ncbi:helix-hairpin-helix domain-containing protein [Chryseobacterium sp. 2TAF14]|uniref:hypothetical protein n=1 Tax=Chryseobacterium sp. 2TAF14 TaxID=3233007 RepID=UPI003F91A6E4
MKKNYYRQMAFLAMLLLTLLGFQKYSEKPDEAFPKVTFISESLPLESLSEFDPNDLDEKQWQKLGFSEKQTATILNYKKIVGGKFLSKEQFRKCYAISGEKYSQLEGFILLPETNIEAKGNSDFNIYNKKSLNITKKFNPDQLSQNDWENMGFSEKQAAAILKYKNYLGGSFVSKEKWLNASTMAKNSDEKKPEFKQEKTDFSKIDMNSITFKQLLEFGLDEKSAGSMIGFRKKLGGFMTKEQILETYNIDKELVQKLLSIATLDNSKVERYTLVNAPEEWLKNHPYFKYSADKIIYYRISNPDDRKIWKFLKTKPEYEARMRLYLK